MTESNRPRHALDDDYTSGYDGYDEAFAFDEPEAPAAAASTSDTQGLPLRGLAMILLAVAVILIGWGGYTLLGGDADNDPANNASDSSTTQTQGEAAPPADNPEAADAEGAPAPADEAPAAEGEDAQAPAPAPGQGAGAQGGVDKNNEYIAVLNNSPIQGLAGDVAGKLRDQQWKETGVGNLPDQAGTFPESVVLYPKGDAAAQAAAEKAAAELGVQARERTAAIDRALAGADMLEGPAPAKVVVVTTNNMPR
ncbi:MAG TPA: LytR C-terminal domain-containing protein [Candidatus Corynebacterium gallistercoris]|uniref:LytR C-terminal domain-containing protein n=1 Tax=Candidatus Corynebacterium gallistercoris TaxID=2838530 RepID=A0A9D1RZY1_9CORY|nr:LytR C-terminal domain-containing protein [Candidatus Corynebacterium gallistercoris]